MVSHQPVSPPHRRCPRHPGIIVDPRCTTPGSRSTPPGIHGTGPGVASLKISDWSGTCVPSRHVTCTTSTPLPTQLPDLREQRRICNCERCIRHATRLAKSVCSADIPITVGVRFLTLPGIELYRSTSSEQQELADLLAKHPERTFVVCSCAPCTAHRNLASAWAQARRYAVPRRHRTRPPGAGGCRERRRD